MVEDVFCSAMLLDDKVVDYLEAELDSSNKYPDNLAEDSMPEDLIKNSVLSNSGGSAKHKIA